MALSPEQIADLWREFAKSSLAYCTYAGQWENQEIDEVAYSGETFESVEREMRRLGNRLLKIPGVREVMITRIAEIRRRR